MYSKTVDFIKHSKKSILASDLSSCLLSSDSYRTQDDGYRTPSPIRYATPDTSPRPINQDKPMEAGCKSVCYTYYPTNNSDSGKTKSENDKKNQTKRIKMNIKLQQ